jgi:hypothetical protein
MYFNLGVMSENMVFPKVQSEDVPGVVEKK